ncbi:MAG TPA: hypothetical protein VGI28_02205 [Stellaceae bacterium]
MFVTGYIALLFAFGGLPEPLARHCIGSLLPRSAAVSRSSRIFFTSPVLRSGPCCRGHSPGAGIDGRQSADQPPLIASLGKKRATHARDAEMSSHRRIIALRRVTFVLAVLLLCAGCASEQDRIQEMEQMLAAAGFHEEPVDSAKRQIQISTLRPHSLLMQWLEVRGNEVPAYIYADPDLCHCVYIGDEKTYQRFQRLALEKKLANEYMTAAEMAQTDTLDWDLWAPDLFPPPIVVLHVHR